MSIELAKPAKKAYSKPTCSLLEGSAVSGLFSGERFSSFRGGRTTAMRFFRGPVLVAEGYEDPFEPIVLGLHAHGFRAEPIAAREGQSMRLVERLWCKKEEDSPAVLLADLRRSFSVKALRREEQLRTLHRKECLLAVLLPAGKGFERHFDKDSEKFWRFRPQRTEEVVRAIVSLLDLWRLAGVVEYSEELV
jgi:hypothetical protein